jgi:hypothetical protein
MTNNCSNVFRSRFASIPVVAVRAILPGTLATLTSEVSTDLGGQVLGEDICGPDIMFGKKNHAHVGDRVPLCVSGVDGAIAMGILLALGGSRFCPLVWGGQDALCIAALILGVLWRGGSGIKNWSWSSHI